VDDLPSPTSADILPSAVADTNGVRRKTWRLGVCAVIGAGLAPALGFALPAILHTDSEFGTTASAVDTAFLFAIGAGCGLAIASFLAVVVVGPVTDFDRVFREALVVGYLALALGILPLALVRLGWDLLGLLGFFVFGALFFSVFILLGAATGVGVRKLLGA